MRNAIAAIVFVSLLLAPAAAFSGQVVDVRIKGLDDGVRTDRRTDYNQAVLFAKRQAIERAGVKVRSRSVTRDMVLAEDVIEAESAAVLMPGYEILDLGYDENGVYQVVLVGKIQVAQEDEAPAQAARAADPVPGGLVLHYDFEGRKAADRSGNGLDARVEGNPGFMPGAVGDAVSLDGVDDFLAIPEMGTDFSEALSISVWVKVNQVKPWGRVLDFSNGEWADNIVLGHLWDRADLQFEAILGNPTHLAWFAQKIVAKGALSPGRFRHLAVVGKKDGQLFTVTLYVDGEARETTDALYRPNTYTNIPGSVVRKVNSIGKSPFAGDSLFCGLVDELRVYDRALSPDEVRRLHAQGAERR